MSSIRLEWEEKREETEDRSKEKSPIANRLENHRLADSVGENLIAGWVALLDSGASNCSRSSMNACMDG